MNDQNLNVQKNKRMFKTKDFIMLGIILVIYIILQIWFPALSEASRKASVLTLKEMMMIMPGIAILMGLFEVWIPKTLIQKYMGEKSGVKAFLLAFVFGTLPTGPLYVAFPLAYGLIKKGASIASVVVFLGTWAAIKVPQLMVEAKFLGLKFAAARFVLTIISLVVMGLVIEKLVKKKNSSFPSKESCSV